MEPNFKLSRQQKTGLITRYLREWEAIREGKDSGYFSTTPFFIPFTDAPARLRKAQYLYLPGLCHAYIGRPDAKERLRESCRLNSDHMPAHFFSKYIEDRKVCKK